MMARVAMLVALIAGVFASAAIADAPARSPLPAARPKLDIVASMLLPTVPAKTVKVVLATSGTAVRISPRPDIRPENLKRRFIVRAAGVRTQPAAPVVIGKRGSVCGDPAIKGRPLSAIPGRLKGCGVAKPVRITSVDGVTLSQPATLNCDAARALKTWVSGTVKPTVGRLGGGVSSLRVAAHYSCRTRNNKKGGKISEHGRGKAIDISAIILKNGVALTVLKGWGDKVQGKILKAIHRNACGTFGTVLGPDSDRYHRDHFHMDVARYRSGTYCR